MGTPQYVGEVDMRSLLVAGVITFIVLLFDIPTKAQQFFKHGEDILQECASSDLFLKGACSGYIVGTIDALEDARRQRHQPSCLPPNPSVEEVIRAVLYGMRADPALQGSLPAFVVVSTVYHRT